MRLNPEQRNHIRKIAKKYNSSAFLYGSRTDDQLKGGDIDLLFIINTSDTFLEERSIFKILNELKKSSCIGDRRIDLKIITKEQLQEDPFLKSIKDTLLEI